MDSNVISEILSFIRLTCSIKGKLLSSYRILLWNFVYREFWDFVFVCISYDANLVVLKKSFILDL